MSDDINTGDSATSTERSLAGRAAALKSWANTDDWSARTRQARQRFLDRFEDDVDPEGQLPPVRARRAAAARRAYFTDLARRSARARRKSGSTAETASLRAELTTALTSLSDAEVEETDR